MRFIQVETQSDHNKMLINTEYIIRVDNPYCGNGCILYVQEPNIRGGFETNEIYVVESMDDVMEMANSEAAIVC